MSRAVGIPNGIVKTEDGWRVTFATGDRILCEALVDAVIFWNIVRPAAANTISVPCLVFEAPSLLPPWHEHNCAKAN